MQSDCFKSSGSWLSIDATEPARRVGERAGLWGPGGLNRTRRRQARGRNGATRGEVRYSSCLLGSWRRCQSKEYEHGAIEAKDILVGQPPDMRTDFGFREGWHLVHHQAAWDAQSIALFRLDRKPEQGCVGLVGRERADRDGFSSVENVILK